MIFECPGSRKLKQPAPEPIKCSYCGKELEIWTDEFRVKCTDCGKTTSREGGQSCLDWCSHARECIGADAYEQYIKNREKKGR